MQIVSTQPYFHNPMGPAQFGQGSNTARATPPGNATDTKPPVPAPGQTESTSDKKSGELDPSEQHEVQQLAARDREVRAHEAAHMAAGGSLVRGGMQLDYERGPDGVLYAVGGEVSIDTGAEKTPEATLRKAETIRRAALAPANPSPQDRSVAAEAAHMAASAQQQLAQQKISKEADSGQEANAGQEAAASRAIGSYQAQSPSQAARTTPSIDEFV